jgi:hypothetical protein
MQTVPVFFVALFKTSDPTAIIPSSAQRFVRLYMYIRVGSKMARLPKTVPPQGPLISPVLWDCPCLHLDPALLLVRYEGIIFDSLKHNGYSEFFSRQFS